MYYLKQAAKTLIETIEEATAYSAENPDGSVSGAYIGLVPFTDNVKVGHLPNAKKWIEYPQLMENYINNVWSSNTGSSGCIVEQDPPGSNWNSTNRVPTTPLNPANKPFKPMIGVNAEEFGLGMVSGEYMLFDDRYPLIGYSVAATNSSRDRLITMRTNNNNTWPARNPSASNSPTGLIFNLAREPEYCTKSKTHFLTKNIDQIQTAIRNMEAYGGTGVSTGLLWAWRMLSPDWRGSNGWGDPDLPRDPDPKLRKIIVLLSDGDNAPVVSRPVASLTTSTRDSYNVNFKYAKCSRYSGSGSNTRCHNRATYSTVTKSVTINGSTSSFAQCPINGLRSAVMTATSFITGTSAQNLTASRAACEVKSTGYNAGTELGFVHHPTEKDSFAGGAMTAQSFDNHLIKVCENIAADKENKITIYSLTLGAGVKNEQSRIIMQNCAVNTGGKYFNAQSSAALSDAFAQIAGALTELRLTK